VEEPDTVLERWIRESYTVKSKEEENVSEG
jgi:endogenous inhibitor of DNA gyrase (YacG/DUF329 family)